MTFISDKPLKIEGDPDITFIIPSTVLSKNRALEKIIGLIEKSGVTEEDDLMWWRLTLDEALVNAVKHGNGSDSHKDVGVRVYHKDGVWTIVIEDEGKGFSEEKVPSLDDDDSLLLNHGRGINMMRHFMDEVKYYSGGTTLCMSKDINSTQPKKE